MKIILRDIPFRLGSEGRKSLISIYSASEPLALGVETGWEDCSAGEKLMYVQFYVRFVKEIMPDSRTGKKPLILSECEVAI